MDSVWMNDMAARLAGHGVSVLRFEFPYMAQRRLDGGQSQTQSQSSGYLPRML